MSKLYLRGIKDHVEFLKRTIKYQYIRFLIDEFCSRLRKVKEKETNQLRIL